MAASSLSRPDAPSHITTFQALSYPDFRKLWIASIFWGVARMMEMTVLAWLVLKLTNSPGQVALVGFFRMMPMFLLGMLAGSIADRFPKKRILVASQLVNLGADGALLLLLLLGTVEPWHCFAAIFLTGISNAMDFSARRSYYAEILPPRLLLNAISLDMASMTGSSMIGPVLGGLLIAFVGFSGAYAAMVAMYFACLALILMVRRPAPEREGVQNPLEQLVASVQTIRTNRILWTVLLVTVALNFFAAPFMSLISVVARDTLGVNEVLYGILSSANGFGALIGSLVIASRGVGRPATTYTLGAAVFLLGILLLAISKVYLLSFVVLMAGGFGMSGFGTMQVTIVLRAVRPQMRGRALGAIALGIGASPLGMLLAGQLAESRGTPMALGVMSAAGVLVLIALFLLFPELRDKTQKSSSPELMAVVNEASLKRNLTEAGHPPSGSGGVPQTPVPPTPRDL